MPNCIICGKTFVCAPNKTEHSKYPQRTCGRKECKKKYASVYAKVNIENHRIALRKWRSNNKEKHNKSNREWRKNNPVKTKEAACKWREKEDNRIKAQRYARNYRRVNPLKYRETQSKWYNNNIGKTRQKSMLYNLLGTAKVNENVKKAVVLIRLGRFIGREALTRKQVKDNLLSIERGVTHEIYN